MIKATQIFKQIFAPKTIITKMFALSSKANIKRHRDKFNLDYEFMKNIPMKERV